MTIGYGINWLLTRKCNLKCSYCSIVRKSDVYPDDPFKTDMDIEKAKKFISRMKKHNQDAFHMFLGGEPTVYPHLEELIDHCNKEQVLYTIITNMTDHSYNRIKNLVNKLGFLNGLTFTIDPILWDNTWNKNDDRYKKSKSAYEKFMSLRSDKRIKEFVALVCVDSLNIKYLHKITQELTNAGVWLDLITLETKLNKYYDFATEMDYDLLITANEENKRILEEVYEKAEKGEYLVLAHKMIDELLIPNLPQHYNCTIEDNLDTLTIDSDGKFRLCLRIRGVNAPKYDILDVLDEDGQLNNDIIRNMKYDFRMDKQNYCYGCMWTCPMFGELISRGIIDPEDMNHENIIIEYEEEVNESQNQ